MELFEAPLFARCRQDARQVGSSDSVVLRCRRAEGMALREIFEDFEAERSPQIFPALSSEVMKFMNHISKKGDGEVWSATSPPALDWRFWKGGDGNSWIAVERAVERCWKSVLCVWPLPLLATYWVSIVRLSRISGPLKPSQGFEKHGGVQPESRRSP